VKLHLIAAEEGLNQVLRVLLRGGDLAEGSLPPAPPDFSGPCGALAWAKRRAADRTGSIIVSGLHVDTDAPSQRGFRRPYVSGPIEVIFEKKARSAEFRTRQSSGSVPAGGSAGRVS
jgi:hypothetical protein